MESDRHAIVYVANEEKELTYLIAYGQTIEDLSIKVYKIILNLCYFLLYNLIIIKLNILLDRLLKHFNKINYLYKNILRM